MSRQLLMLTGLVLCFIISGCGNTPHREVATLNREFYEKGKNTPAEYIVNSMASGRTRDAILLLRGRKKEDVRKALKNVTEFKRMASLGFNWPEKKPREVMIPYSPDMKNTLLFQGEYTINEYSANGNNSTWKICWDEKHLHFKAEFEDNDIQSDNENPWNGDSLEIFVMPEKRLKVYREVVIPPEGKYYTAINSNNHWGLFLPDIDCVTAKGIIVENEKSVNGFRISCSIPWAELPGYFRGNTPRVGEVVHFMLVRTNKTNQGKATHSAMVPLLYGGHNIFGYAKATLSK